MHFIVAFICSSFFFIKKFIDFSFFSVAFFSYRIALLSSWCFLISAMFHRYTIVVFCVKKVTILQELSQHKYMKGRKDRQLCFTFQHHGMSLYFLYTLFCVLFIFINPSNQPSSFLHAMPSYFSSVQTFISITCFFLPIYV